MKFVLLIFLFIIGNNCYKILSSREIVTFLNDNSVKPSGFDTCLKTNYCFVYYLKSGMVALLPNNYSDENSKGILFATKKCFSECIENDTFPIENPNMKVEEKYKMDIENLKENMSSIIQTLVSKFMPDQENSKIDTSRLARLLIILKQKKLTEKELFYAALTLGEYVRQVHHGDWLLLKDYGTFNPFYIPAIVYSDNSVFPLWDYLTSFFKDSNTTPEIYAQLPWVKTPSLKIGNNFFKDRFSGYKRP